MSSTPRSKSTVPSRRRADDDCVCDCNGRGCRIVCGVLLCVLLAILGFALYSAFCGLQDANRYYLNCVGTRLHSALDVKCIDSTKSDCIFDPRRTCAVSTVGYIIGSVFFWVFYVAIQPIVGPFAIRDWIAGLF